MDKKIFNALGVLSAVLWLATMVGFLLDLVPGRVALVMLAALVILLAATIYFFLRSSRDVMDAGYTVENPGREYQPGDTVSYSVKFTAKESFELTRFTVFLFKTFSDIQTFTDSKWDSKVHAENRKIAAGTHETFRGSFELPRDRELLRGRNSWRLEFLWEIKSMLDKIETIEIIKRDETQIYGEY